MKNKSEAPDKVIELIKQLQVRLNKILKVFHTDGAKEFEHNKLKSFFKENGTIQTCTTPHTPQHNGKVERAFRTIFDCVRTVIKHAQLPFSFWGYAAAHVIHVRNRTTLIKQHNKTPVQLFTNSVPSIEYFRVFGCDVYVHTNQSNKLSKDQNKSEKGISKTTILFNIYVEYKKNNSFA